MALIAPDVNVLVDAFREDARDHPTVSRWLAATLASPATLALFEPVLAGFLRIVTHPRIFRTPTPLAAASAFVEALRAQPNALTLRAGPRHWEIFARLCRDDDARGNRVPDAYLAALALEHGAAWVSSDHGFRRFQGLNWRPPQG
jgi:toxin-antitoxin system PIN domain toxin